jgi:BMFP domain-containing protein YqiC
LSSELIPARAAPASSEGERLLAKAQRHKQKFPQKIFVSRDDVESLIRAEAQKQKIDVVKVADDELLVFIDEARQAFAERFGGLNA